MFQTYCHKLFTSNMSIAVYNVNPIVDCVSDRKFSFAIFVGPSTITRFNYIFGDTSSIQAIKFLIYFDVKSYQWNTWFVWNIESIIRPWMRFKNVEHCTKTICYIDCADLSWKIHCTWVMYLPNNLFCKFCFKNLTSLM